MINKKLLLKIQVAVISVLCLIITVFAYMLGSELGKKDMQNYFEKVHNIKIGEKVEQTEINPKKVEEFLIAYFTKNDLGENRSRFKPYMTESMYNSELKEENKPINAAYKGFLVDYVLESSDIYINNDKKEAIVSVKYQNKKLDKKDDRTNASTKTHNETYKITFIKSNNGDFLVNSMEKIEVSEKKEVSVDNGKSN